MKISEKYGLDKKQSVILIGAFILGAIGFCYAMYQLATVSEDSYKRYIDILIYLVTFDYAIRGYKVPHGETLKLIMMLFAGSLAFRIVFESESSVFAEAAYCALAASTVLISFMCGRLNRFLENKRMIIVIYVLLALFAGIGVFVLSDGFLAGLESLNPLIQWVMLSSAYMVRFQLHQEAGLEDK